MAGNVRRKGEVRRKVPANRVTIQMGSKIALPKYTDSAYFLVTATICEKEFLEFTCQTRKTGVTQSIVKIRLLFGRFRFLLLDVSLSTIHARCLVGKPVRR
jgi:hypothetical protein